MPVTKDQVSQDMSSVHLVGLQSSSKLYFLFSYIKPKLNPILMSSSIFDSLGLGFTGTEMINVKARIICGTCHLGSEGRSWKSLKLYPWDTLEPPPEGDYACCPTSGNLLFFTDEPYFRFTLDSNWLYAWDNQAETSQSSIVKRQLRKTASWAVEAEIVSVGMKVHGSIGQDLQAMKVGDTLQVKTATVTLCVTVRCFDGASALRSLPPVPGSTFSSVSLDDKCKWGLGGSVDDVQTVQCD